MRFKNNEWSVYGELKNGRSAHGSITFGQETLIIGGGSNDETS